MRLKGTLLMAQNLRSGLIHFNLWEPIEDDIFVVRPPLDVVLCTLQCLFRCPRSSTQFIWVVFDEWYKLQKDKHKYTISESETNITFGTGLWRNIPLGQKCRHIIRHYYCRYVACFYVIILRLSSISNSFATNWLC